MLASLNHPIPESIEIALIECIKVEFRLSISSKSGTGPSIGERVSIPRTRCPCSTIWLLRDIPQAHEVEIIALHPVEIASVVERSGGETSNLRFAGRSRCANQLNTP